MGCFTTVGNFVAYISYMYHKNHWNKNRWCWRLRLGHNLLELISNYSGSTGCPAFFLKMKQTILNVLLRIPITLILFKYKTKLIGTLGAADEILENVAVTILLIYLNNFADYLKYHCLISQ